MNPRMHQPLVAHIGIRCQAQDQNSAFGFCGRPAVRHRPGRLVAPDAYYCAEHAAPTDAEMPAEPSVRLVSLAIGVQLAGVSQMHVAAQNEAVEFVEAALKALGCRVDVQRVTSGMARVAPPARTERQTAAAGKG
jgi:hypothetical protein